MPERLREVLRELPARSGTGFEPVAARTGRRTFRRGPSFLEAAAAILVFCAGGALGWFAHDVVRPVPSIEDMLLADMTRAYAFYGARDYPVAFPPDRAEEFVTWIGRSFERDVRRPPDLANFGYTYRGGRLIPAVGTRIGLFQFERAEGAGLAVFFWTTAAPPQVVRALSDRESVAAHFWNTNGLSFAVVSEKANRDLETAAKAVFSFYEQAFDPQLSGSNPPPNGWRSAGRAINAACGLRSGRTAARAQAGPGGHRPGS